MRVLTSFRLFAILESFAFPQKALAFGEATLLVVFGGLEMHPDHHNDIFDGTMLLFANATRCELTQFEHQQSPLQQRALVTMNQSRFLARAVRVSNHILVCGGSSTISNGKDTRKKFFEKSCLIWNRGDEKFKTSKVKLPNGFQADKMMKPENFFMASDPDFSESGVIFLFGIHSDDNLPFYTGTFNETVKFVNWQRRPSPKNISIGNFAGACAIAAGNHFLVLGMSSHKPQVLHYSFKKGKWSRQTDMEKHFPKLTRLHAGCALFHGNVVISGGDPKLPGSYIRKDVHHYNIMKKDWDVSYRIVPIKERRSGHVMATLNNGKKDILVVAFGATSSDHFSNTMEYYNHREIKPGWKIADVTDVGLYHPASVVIPTSWIPGCYVPSTNENTRPAASSILIAIIMLINFFLQL